MVIFSHLKCMKIAEIKELIKNKYKHINYVDMNMPLSNNNNNLCIKDILEKKVNEKYYIPQKIIDVMKKDPDFILKNIKYKPTNEIIKLYNKSITGKNSQGSAVYHYHGIMSTLNAGSHGYSMGQILDPFSKDIKARKLTPLECERIMGWPDNWTKYGEHNKQKYELSETARYKAIGNGIVSKIPKLILETMIKDKKIRIFSTFSGVDGSCMALDKRFQLVAFSEFDPKNIKQQNAANVLKYQYPEVPNLGDITKIKTSDVPDHDCMFISAPCQAFSIAGKRASLTDSRGTLFYDTARILKEKQPRYAIFENVKGLVIGKEVNTFIHMLEIYSEAGYQMDFHIYNAKNFGVPQNRERIFMFLKRIK